MILSQKQIDLLKSKAIIEIDKEWVECPKWNASHELPFFDCFVCKGKGKISKYKVGDVIQSSNIIVPNDTKFTFDRIPIKLKIISETEDKYKVIMVR